MSSQLQEMLARQLDEARAEFRERALTTSPVDFERLRKAIGKIYSQRGAQPPSLFLRCESPMEAMAVVNFLTTRCGLRGHARALPDRNQLQPLIALEDAPAHQWLQMVNLRPWFDAAIPKKGEVDPATIANRVIEVIGKTKNVPKLKKQIPKIAEAGGLTPAGSNPLSMLSVNRPAYFHAPPCDAADLLLVHLLETVGLFSSGQYQSYVDAFKAGGWWWTLEDMVVWCDNPSVLNMQNNLPHSLDGPAVSFNGHWDVFAVNGRIVPARVICDQITIADVQFEENAEIRAILLDRLGMENFIKLSNSRVVSRDECGVLYHVETPLDREPFMCLVEVINSTPEPDGTFRKYYLRVPPTMWSAKQAVAWSFNLRENEYQPLYQS